MKRFKKNIGLVLTILGMFLAIGTADGSNYEILLRLGGVVMFAVGGYMSEAFYFQQDNKQ
ncbi:MAG: hypothetical protein IKM23_09540 [Bacteroidales bacterium]|nr:hypothetical protein [Bacteroidales bacterium]